MKEEKRQILKMLQDGKVSLDEAMKLLDAVGDDKASQPSSPKTTGKMLRVRVEEGGKAKVNVNIPLALAKLALRFIPKDARQELVDQNIDLDEVISSITETTTGKIVEVNDDEDDTKVEVFVE